MSQISQLVTAPAEIALTFTGLLGFIAFKSYSRTGPKVKQTIEIYFKNYAIWSFARLLAWVFSISFVITAPGLLMLTAVEHAFQISLPVAVDYFASIFFFGFSCFLFLSHNLFFIPASLQLSSQFRFSRLMPLWRLLTERRIVAGKKIFLFAVTIFYCYIAILYIRNNDLTVFFYSAFSLLFYFAVVPTNGKKEIKISSKSGNANSCKCNILLIGVDTLRSDRLGAYNYFRDLTPNIDKLCSEGVLFENCITPLARTAPSLLSLFSGLWPHNHHVRDNYPSSKQAAAKFATLVRLLNENEYQSVVISDWAGADFKKIGFGFIETAVPDDQWNIKLLLRQGPPYLRLFLSLFTHNSFGKRFLPEIYYLAGKPLTSHLGRECRKKITALAEEKKPFFINLFTSTTHVPFGSEYPYYNLFTPDDYQGESRFIMGDLTTPEQIVESQESTVERHDLKQIINLYDNCVKEFDDEVGKIIKHIDRCGLRDNTYIVLYTDHGTDFFETECWGQGNTLIGNDPSARIPMIISGPGIPKNVRFSHICRSIDFMPTMLDLLELEIPKDIDGVSLLPYIKNNSNPNLYAYQETGVWMGKIPGLHPDQITYPDIIELLTISDIESGTLVIDEKYYPAVIKAKNRSIQDDRWKLIYIPTYHGAVYQLYDLQTDPYRNVVDQYPNIVAKLKPLLDNWINQPAFTDHLH